MRHVVIYWDTQGVPSEDSYKADGNVKRDRALASASLGALARRSLRDYTTPTFRNRLQVARRAGVAHVHVCGLSHKGSGLSNKG